MRLTTGWRYGNQTSFAQHCCKLDPNGDILSST